MARLSQILALEKSAHAEAKKIETELHRKSAAKALFEGFHKKYMKKSEEDGEDLPTQSQKVQAQADELLTETKKTMSPVFDLILTKDTANCSATANVEVDGKTLLEGVPVTTLLFLEKELTDLKTFISALPVLDSADNWKLDGSSGLWKTDPVETFRTKKVQKALVLYPATDKHPAQTQLVTEDIVAGTYLHEKHSGAMPETRKKELIERCNKLLAAVKTAREEANSIKVEEKKMAEAVFNFILG